MRNILLSRARLLVNRSGVVVTVTTASDQFDVVGIFREPHQSPEVGYGMISQIPDYNLTCVVDDISDVEIQSKVIIEDKNYAVTMIEPDEHNVLVTLRLTVDEGED